MLNLKPLFKVVVEVAPNMAVGSTPWGVRSIGEIRSAAVEGERLQASLAGAAAADWMLVGGGVGQIDVRMTLKTDDGALILMTYGGRLDLANREDGLKAYVAPVFETGDERYAWLNRIQAVGRGLLTPGAESTRIDYEVYELV